MGRKSQFVWDVIHQMGTMVRPTFFEVEDWHGVIGDNNYKRTSSQRRVESVRSLGGDAFTRTSRRHSNPNPSKFDEEATVKLMVYNAQQSGSLQDDRIADEIGKELAKSDYDVVALTGVYDQMSRDIIANRVSRDGKFKNAVTRAGASVRCGLGTCSGLMLMSRYPIIEARYYRFRKTCIKEKFGSRGILFVTLEVNGAYLLIGHTQLDTSTRDGEANRKCQMEECVREMKNEEERLRKRGITNYVTVLCGEFNFTDVSGAEANGFKRAMNPYRDPMEYKERAATVLEAYPDATDTYRTLHPNEIKDPGYTFDIVENTKNGFDRQGNLPPYRERLGHIWILQPQSLGAEMECAESDINDMGHLSQHFAVYSKLLMRNRELPIIGTPHPTNSMQVKGRRSNPALSEDDDHSQPIAGYLKQ